MPTSSKGFVLKLRVSSPVIVNRHFLDKFGFVRSFSFVH